MNESISSHIRLFGAPEITSASPEHKFPAKGYMLMALLLLCRTGAVTRQAVASQLWSSVDETNALGNLRQLLVRVRRAERAAGDLVCSQGLELSAGAAARASDLAEFLAHRDATDASGAMRAVQLFRGDLLVGLEDEDTAQWLRNERALLRESFFALALLALEEATRFAAASHVDIRAVEDRLLDVDPDREESHRVLLDCYGRIGDFEGAKRIKGRLNELLKRDPGVRLTAATAATVDRVTRAERELQFREDRSGAQPRGPRIAFHPTSIIEPTADAALYRALIEDVADGLSTYRTFTVIAPHSSFRVADSAEAAPQASTLRADYWVTSSLKPDAELMTFRLTAWGRPEIIWAAQYPARSDRLRTTFRLLSRQIVTSLAREIERERFTICRSRQNNAAYVSFLQGMQSLSNCDLPMLRRARVNFRKAVELDPGFAEARARVAQTLQLEWLLLGGNDPYLLQRAKADAEAATRIDPGAAVGHWMAAVVALYQRDYDGAADRFLQAETLSPNSADLLIQHADALAHFGDPEAGWLRFQEAIDINPLPPDSYWWAGASIAFKRADYAGAIRLCGSMQSEEPVLRLLTASHALNNDLPSARSYARRLRHAYPGLSARDIVKLSPDRNKQANETFLEGLRLAGLG